MHLLFREMSTETKGILIREAVPSDADELIAHVNALADEVGIYIALSSGEFKLTSDEERKFLEEFASSKNSIFLVADFEGEIIGNLNCHGGSRSATRHSATLGMSVSIRLQI